MKKLLLSFFLVSLLACNNNADKKTGDKDTNTSEKNDGDKKSTDQSIVGKWRPIDANLDGMEGNDKQELLDHATIEFTADGKFISTMKDKVNNGTYVYDAQANKLSTRESEGKEEMFDVSWKGEQITLTNEDGSVTMKRTEN